MEIRYKSLLASLSSKGHKFEVGKWYKIDGSLVVYNNGFHAFKNIIDAMDYLSGEVLAKVQVRGKCIIEAEKECWEEMKVVKIRKLTTKDGLLSAIFASELVLPIYEEKYPWSDDAKNAIKSAKKVFKNDTAKNRAAARLAANSAAYVSQSWIDSAGLAAKAAAYAADAAAFHINCTVYSAVAPNVVYAAHAAADAAAYAADPAFSEDGSTAYSPEYSESAVYTATYNKILNKCHKFVIERVKL